MPLEGSKSRIGPNLELNFKTCIQPQPYRSSVSVTDSKPNVDSPIDSTALASCIPSGHSVCGSTEISPSPLSSTANTISPNSPLSSTSPRLCASPDPGADMAAGQFSTMELSTTTTSSASCSAPSSSSAAAAEAAASSPRELSDRLNQLLLHCAATECTVDILCALLDSRLPLCWREPLNTGPHTLIKYNPSRVRAQLIDCVRDLTDHFESRYGKRLGDLLQDVAGLGGLNNTEDPSTEDQSTEDPDDQIEVCSTSARRTRFHTVLAELFHDQINWGRVVAMLAFVRAVCVVAETDIAAAAAAAIPSLLPGNSSTDDQLLTSDSSVGNEFRSHRPRAAHYLVWTAEFVHQSSDVWNWICQNGGWEGLIKFGSDREILSGQRAHGDHHRHEDDDDHDEDEDETVRLFCQALTGMATLALGAVGLLAAWRYLTKRI